MATTLTTISQAQYQAITQGGAESKAIATGLSRNIAASLIGPNGRPINGNLRLHANNDGTYSVRMSQWSNKTENRAFNDFARQLTEAAFGTTARDALAQYQTTATRTGSHSYFKLVQTAYTEQKNDGLVKVLKQGDGALNGSEAVSEEMDKKLRLSSAKETSRIGAHLPSRLTPERTFSALEAVIANIKRNPKHASLGSGAFGSANLARLDDGSEVVVKTFASPSPFNLDRSRMSAYSVGMSTYLGHSKLTDFSEGKKRLASPTHYLVSKDGIEAPVLLDIKQARRLMKEQRTAGTMTATCHATVSPKAQGESLQNLRGKMNDTEQKQVFRELLTYLRSTAERGIVHRDLTPDNIFSDKGADEGAARTIQVIDTDLMIKNTLQGRPGDFHFNTAGKALYMAPKVALCRAYGPEADMHSVGMVVLGNRFPVLTETLATCLFVRLPHDLSEEVIGGEVNRLKTQLKKDNIPSSLYEKIDKNIEKNYVQALKDTAKKYWSTLDENQKSGAIGKELAGFLKEMDDPSTITGAALSLIGKVDENRSEWISNKSRLLAVNAITATTFHPALTP